jgi:hypothetical protein
MDDLSLTQLFQRMDAHLSQQDAHLAQQDVWLQTTLTNMVKQNLVLEQTAQLLSTTTRMLEESLRESRLAWAAEREARAEVLRGLVALRDRLEGRG